VKTINANAHAIQMLNGIRIWHLQFDFTEGGGALGVNKASTHHVIDIFLYPLGAVEAACALEVDAMGALDLVEVQALGSSSSSSSLDI
nr:hypothetical protein [Tanacetum cinerariifolium]